MYSADVNMTPGQWMYNVDVNMIPGQWMYSADVNMQCRRTFRCCKFIASSNTCCADVAELILVMHTCARSDTATANASRTRCCISCKQHQVEADSAGAYSNTCTCNTTHLFCKDDNHPPEDSTHMSPLNIAIKLNQWDSTARTSCLLH